MSGPVLRFQYEDWADQLIELPAYQTVGAAGADIRSNLPADTRTKGMELAPSERALVPTGLRVEIPTGYEMQVRPRSGLALNHGVTVANAPGTIDSDYRGPIGVMLINLGAERFQIAHGDRIAQIVIAPVVQPRFELADILGQTQRGQGGFGSTGRF